MNTRLKTTVTFALVVVLSAGLAMAGRGGGGGHAGGGGGGHAGGGGGHAGGGGGGFHASSGGGYHAPSFSTPHQSFLRAQHPHQSFSTPHQSFNTPHQSFSTPHQSFNTPIRAATPRLGETTTFGRCRRASRPGTGQRPGFAGTPAWDNRLNAGNRPGFDNRANFGNRAYVANRPNFGNNFNINRMNNFVRPTHNDWNRGDWYHGDWHGNWNNSWYQRPTGWWAAGGWAGDNAFRGSLVLGILAVLQPLLRRIVRHRQRLRLLAADRGGPGGCRAGRAPAGLTAEQQATPLFDAARIAFMQGDYKTALAQVDQAIAQVPNDTVLHEFRGLALFALWRYKEAAAADYAVLSAGPGWDWTTLIGLYPNVEVYTEQLRALEQYAKSHPAASEARFLLAENYLTCGHADAAAAQLKEGVRLDPKDQLSAQLLGSISASGAAEPAVSSQPAAPAKPADAAASWATGPRRVPDSATIKLALAGDGKFTWAVDQNGKPQQFSGTYTVADNLLVLKQGSNAMMVGQVAALASGRFNFKLAGDNPSDPGLTFVR